MKRKEINSKTCIYLAITGLLSTVVLRPSPGLATEVDGVLNTRIGNAGYVQVENSLDAWSRLYKLKNDTYVQFGSRLDKKSHTCLGMAAQPLLTNITNRGSSFNRSFGSRILEKVNTRNQGSFSSVTQDKKGLIFLAGGVSDVGQVDSPGGGFGCTYDNNRIFITKLTDTGNPVLEFGARFQVPGTESDGILYLDEVLGESTTTGYITSITNISAKVLAVTIIGNASFDLLYLNSVDGSINRNYGIDGKLSLNIPSLNIFESVKTEDGIVLAGDLINNSNNDWFLRWAVTEINNKGIETSRFKGQNNFQYSSGYKEGVYWTPVFKEPYIYFVGGVYTGSVYEIKVMRIDQNGKLDANYGGYLRSQLLDLGVNPISYGSGEFVVDSDGRILVTIGTDSHVVSDQRNSAVIRLDTTGKIDTSFGSTGKIWVDFDYQAGIYPIDDNNFLIYGTQYSPSYCSSNGMFCGLNQTQLAHFSQLNLPRKTQDQGKNERTKG